MRATRARPDSLSTTATAAPGVLLVLAAAIVGLASALDGTAARLLNGVGGLCWLAAAALLARSLRRARERRLSLAVVAVAVLVLALAVRPSDLPASLVGFSVAGALVAVVARHHPLRWALLVPAAWLPAHLAIAILRAFRDGTRTVRTDPPPTAALVPLSMVLAALAAAWLVDRRRQAIASRPPTLPVHAD